MLKNKTIVLDLDGTLLNDEKNISFDDIQTILNLSKNNSIILASGRNYIDMIKIVDRYELKNIIEKYIICSNGQQIYDILEEKVVYERFISYDECISIISFLNRKNIYWYIVSGNTVFCEKIKYNCEKYIKNNRYKIHILENISDIKKVKIEKFIINAEKTDKLINIKEHILKIHEVDFFILDRIKEYNNLYYLQNNIVPRNINKYTAAVNIISELNLGNEIVAFGNGINDYELLKRAKIGICVENASIEIKEISDFITRSNNHSAVTYAIKKIEKLK